MTCGEETESLPPHVENNTWTVGNLCYPLLGV